MLNQSLACSDPQPGDVVAKGFKTRIVTERNGGEVQYQTESGKNKKCWISTWQEWCRKSDYAMTKGSSKNG